jgi:hypothetical protein
VRCIKNQWKLCWNNLSLRLQTRAPQTKCEKQNTARAHQTSITEHSKHNQKHYKSCFIYEYIDNFIIWQRYNIPIAKIADQNNTRKSTNACHQQQKKTYEFSFFGIIFFRGLFKGKIKEPDQIEVNFEKNGVVPN